MLIAEGHGIVRAGLRLLVEKLQDVEVVGEAADGHEAVRLAKHLRLDLALMEVSLGGINGVDATRHLVKENPRTRVLLLSTQFDEGSVRNAMHAGAAGYVLKQGDSEELSQAIRAIVRGLRWISPAVGGAVIAGRTHGTKGHLRGPFELLTPRQREVLQLVAEGSSTKEIAHRLDLSVKTIECHRHELMCRLGLHNVAALVRYAIRTGIIRSEA
jgi:DNA-binding NarL/FixJ family response regulator